MDWCQGSCQEPAGTILGRTPGSELGCETGSDCLSCCLQPLVKADSPAYSQSSKGSIELLSHIPHVSTIYKNSFHHWTAKLKPLVQNQSHRSYKVSQEIKQKRIRALSALYPWSSRKGGSQQMTLEDILHCRGRQNNCNRPASMTLGIFSWGTYFSKYACIFQDGNLDLGPHSNWVTLFPTMPRFNKYIVNGWKEFFALN